MAYSDFTLAGAIQTFNLTLTEQLQLFAPIPEQPASDFLQETLRRNVPLAIASNSEKACSELIIAPILVEVREHRHSHCQCSFQSSPSSIAVFVSFTSL